jgi:phage-related minor tail protein
MTTIGYATLQIIPSLDGVSEAVDKQLGGKFQAAGKSGGKALAKGVGEGMKDLERDVESASRAYGKLKDKASDALGKVRADEAALKRLRDTGASDDRVIRAEERLATSRRNSSRASRDAEDSHKSLLSAQNALGAGTDDLGSKFGGMAGFASTAGAALASAGAIAGGAALAGVAALGAGLVVAGRELYDLGASFDDVFDNLRLKTGATGPALQELQNATERIATSVPASIADIGDVVAETSRAFKGLSGADFDNLTSHLANLNRLTGENVNVRELARNSRRSVSTWRRRRRWCRRSRRLVSMRRRSSQV